jgi:GT2 family glycosyltransferase
MKTTIAVLLTCHNRKQKTLRCLKTLFEAKVPSNYSIDIYLVDDGSSDGTDEAVRIAFPMINIIKGNGKLFWAGGMRLAWDTSLKSGNYKAFILLNDDVELDYNYFELFIKTHQFALNEYGKGGVYSAATAERKSKKITYGGNIILSRGLRIVSKRIDPIKIPQKIDVANANILWVDNSVVNKIGILNEKYTHGIADYDYALRANKATFPVLLTMGIGGYCKNEHGNNWMSENNTFAERLNYLKSPTGLAYKEYLYYVWQHFPLSLPYAFSTMWLKTLFPKSWNYFKV